MNFIMMKEGGVFRLFMIAIVVLNVALDLACALPTPGGTSVTGSQSVYSGPELNGWTVVGNDNQILTPDAPDLGMELPDDQGIVDDYQPAFDDYADPVLDDYVDPDLDDYVDPVFEAPVDQSPIDDSQVAMYDNTYPDQQFDYSNADDAYMLKLQNNILQLQNYLLKTGKLLPGDPLLESPQSIAMYPDDSNYVQDAPLDPIYEPVDTIYNEPIDPLLDNSDVGVVPALQLDLTSPPDQEPYAVVDTSSSQEVPEPNPKDAPTEPAPEVPEVPVPEVLEEPVPNMPAAPVPKVSAAPAPEVPEVPVPEVLEEPVPEAPAAPVPKVSAAPAPKVPQVSEESTPKVPPAPAPEVPATPAPASKVPVSKASVPEASSPEPAPVTPEEAQKLIPEVPEAASEVSAEPNPDATSTEQTNNSSDYNDSGNLLSPVKDLLDGIVDGVDGILGGIGNISGLAK